MYIAIVARYNENKKRFQVSSALIQRLLHYHAIPIIIYPSTPLDEILQFCEALIISGGDDVNPCHYHRLPTLEVIEDEQIEQLDFQCLDAFIQAKKPVLGICRGIQVIAVYYQASLKNIQHHDHTSHSLVFHPQSYFKSNPSFVYSYHHQSLEKLPQGFLLSAYSKDHMIEAIEKKDVFAVQWHPELEENDLIIPLFLQYVSKKKINNEQNS